MSDAEERKFAAAARSPVPVKAVKIGDAQPSVGIKVLQALTLGRKIMLYTILIIILVLALIGGLPAWPYSEHWGYYPSGGIGLVLLILVILLVVRRA